MIVGFLVLAGGVRVVKEALWVFLELVPSGYNIEEITNSILEVPGVLGIHDVHLWSISHGNAAFSAHLWVADQRLSEADMIREDIEKRLAGIGITHTVLQLECAECKNSNLYCQVLTEDLHDHHH
jgi:cobalt-zinc-cadmium efflux system protein